MAEEILNQESNLDESLFDEIDESDSTEEAEAPAEDESKEETPSEEEAKPEPFLNIRYNKEDVALTREEAIELAQKGKNYDKVLGSYNDLNSKISRLAKMNGMDISTYLENLNKTQMNFEVSKETKELKKKYPNSDDVLLEELARRNVSERLGKEEKAEETIPLAEIERQAKALEKYYPGVDIAKLDDEVLDYMNDGLTMLEAYSLWKGKQAQSDAEENARKQKIASRNEENRRKSYGAVESSGSIEADDFMKGFLG